MKFIKTISIIILSIFSFELFAQDIHFTQFYATPLLVSPANAGSFDGDFRFIANYRNQWATVPVPFNSVAASVDGKLFVLGNFDHVNGGLRISYDKAGDSKLTTTNIGASVSYFKSLDRDSLHFISIAVEPGVVLTGFNTSDLYFDNQYNDGIFNPDLSPNEIFGRETFSYFDLAAGLGYHFRKNSRNLLSLSLGIFHLNKPAVSYFLNPLVELRQRVAISANAQIKISKDFDLLPVFLYQLQDAKHELLAGVSAKYHFSENNSTALDFGLLYRNSDSFIFTTGLDYEQMKLGLSYDLNISNLKEASSLYGGVELSFQYFITKVKKIRADGAICPVF